MFRKAVHSIMAMSYLLFSNSAYAQSTGPTGGSISQAVCVSDSEEPECKPNRCPPTNQMNDIQEFTSALYALNRDLTGRFYNSRLSASDAQLLSKFVSNPEPLEAIQSLLKNPQALEAAIECGGKCNYCNKLKFILRPFCWGICMISSADNACRPLVQACKNSELPANLCNALWYTIGCPGRPPDFRK
jgi:hypothetical protein